MEIKNIIIYIFIICFIFIFLPKNSLSEDIKLQLKQSINLNDLTCTSKNKLIKIRPKDGFIIEVKGKKERWIALELDNKEDDDGIKIVEFNPENESIRLNKNGVGTFRIGALIAVENILQPGLHRSEVRAKFKYID